MRFGTGPMGEKAQSVHISFTVRGLRALTKPRCKHIFLSVPSPTGWGYSEASMDHCSHDSAKALGHLKTVRGQIDGITRMIEEDRYCIDVSNQISAAIALLKKANLIILKQHMNTCVADAIKAKDGSEKIDEISMILEKYIG